MTPDLVSQRQAAALLHECGVSRRQAHGLLQAGLAGAPVRMSGLSLYDRSIVEGLVGQPLLGRRSLDALCPHGVFVSRRMLDLSSDSEGLRGALADGWDISLWTCLELEERIAEIGPFPLIATIGGFVVGGAEITDIRRRGGRRSSLTLREPGPWFESARAHRLRTGPGREWAARGLRGIVDAVPWGPDVDR